MIITRTPFRITLGGGGTDLPSYYHKYGGFLISAAINKYVYVTVNRRFEEQIRVSYSKTEIVDQVDKIEHPIVREALKLAGISQSVEITSIADLPTRSGLGSSGSFTVGLLNALHAYKREFLTPRELAEEAFYIESELLGEPVGKQDQYIAAYGGVVSMRIDRNGEVTVDTHIMSRDAMDEFESNTLYFYTQVQRRAPDILSEQQQSISQNKKSVVDAMHAIKKLGEDCLVKLKDGDLDWFGKSLDEHWTIKKRMSSRMSGTRLDKWYEAARDNGASGGKIMGAGGGGFFMFYCKNGKSKIRQALVREGLREIRFRIEPEGSKVLFNL